MTSCPTAELRDETNTLMLTVDGATVDPDSGAYWSVGKIIGWWETGPVRSVVVDDEPIGQTITLAKLQARSIVLELLAHTLDGQTPLGTPCIDATHSAKVAFRRAMYVEHTLTIDDGSSVGPLHAGVRLVRPLRAQILGAKVAVRIQVSLLAPDPFLYDAGDTPYD